MGMQDGSLIKAIPTMPSSVGMKSAEKLAYQGGAGKGHSVQNASGTILQSGLPFYFHYTEEFHPDTGERTLRVRIDIG